MSQISKKTLKYELDWMDKSFQAHLEKRFLVVNSAEIERRLNELMEIEYDNVTDRQSQSHIRMCAITLAYFEALDGEQCVIEKMNAAVSEYGAYWVKRMTKIAFWLSFDRRKTLEKISYQKMRDVYGESFEIEAERGQNSFVTRVNKCAYHDFFNRHNCRELTSCFCQWDMNWASVLIENPKLGIEFSRDCTLAKGDESCDFCFKFCK